MTEINKKMSSCLLPTILDEKQVIEYMGYLKSNDTDALKKHLLDIVPTGTMIYKYCRGLVRDLNTMKQKKLWLSNASSFNDPFDCAYLVNKRSTLLRVLRS